MAEFDVLDEAIINAKPDIVYKEILSGAAHHRVGAKRELCEGGAPDQLGALVETTLPGKFRITFVTKPSRLKRTSCGALNT